jgi:hypothetical protein
MTLFKSGDHVRLHEADRKDDPPELAIGVVIYVAPSAVRSRDDCLVQLDATEREVWWWADQLEAI